MRVFDEMSEKVYITYGGDDPENSCRWYAAIIVYRRRRIQRTRRVPLVDLTSCTRHRMVRAECLSLEGLPEVHERRRVGDGLAMADHVALSDAWQRERCIASVNAAGLVHCTCLRGRGRACIAPGWWWPGGGADFCGDVFVIGKYNDHNHWIMIIKNQIRH